MIVTLYFRNIGRVQKVFRMNCFLLTEEKQEWNERFFQNIHHVIQPTYSNESVIGESTTEDTILL